MFSLKFLLVEEFGCFDTEKLGVHRILLFEQAEPAFNTTLVAVC
jgi:hypothetical protein